MIYFILLIFTVHATNTERNKLEHISWESFTHMHNKTYINITEERHRQQIFFNNLGTIESHNKLFTKGVVTYKLGVNQYADITSDEFRDMILNTNMVTKTRSNDKEMLLSNPRGYSLEGILPEHVDWRQSNAISPIKNQGTCGSCWAFSAAATLESAYFIKTGLSIILSEQNLLDCTSGLTDEDNNCNGGTVEDALDYAHNYGVTSTEKYPYAGTKQKCRYNTTDNILPKVYGYVPLVSGDENMLKAALAFTGPVSICVDATYIQFYREGVFNDKRCRKDVGSLTHALVVIGYGRNGDQEYWILKNSWGEKWGEHGYMKLARNKANMCGVATQAIYPLL